MSEQYWELLCEKYYKRVDSKSAVGDPSPGQLVIAHTTYPPPDPWIVKVISYNPSDLSRCKYEMKKYQDGDRSHMPVAELQLRSDENFYVYKGKERPLVVIGSVKSEWGNALKPDHLFLCVPMFTFKDRHSDVFRSEIQAFGYPNLFFLPKALEGCAEDSVIRLELAQPITRRALRNVVADGHAVALSEESFALLMAHLARFWLRRDIDSEICETIDCYRELIFDAIKKSGA